jgi:hypothetical protein
MIGKSNRFSRSPPSATTALEGALQLQIGLPELIIDYFLLYFV